MDSHPDVCAHCQLEGELLMCDGCELGAYHLACLDPPLKAIPRNDWFCPACTQVKSLKKRKVGAGSPAVPAKRRQSFSKPESETPVGKGKAKPSTTPTQGMTQMQGTVKERKTLTPRATSSRSPAARATDVLPAVVGSTVVTGHGDSSKLVASKIQGESTRAAQKDKGRVAAMMVPKAPVYMASGERVAANDLLHDSMWYGAVIREVKDEADGTVALVHFDGWNRRYDQWLAADLVRPISQLGALQQAQLQALALRDSPSKKRKTAALAAEENSRFELSPTSSSTKENDTPKDRQSKRRRSASIGGISTATHLTADTAEEGSAPPGLKSQLRCVYDKVVAGGQIFLEPFVRLPSKRDFPDYYQVITQPVCLSMVDKRLRKGDYTSVEAFERDMLLICTNCQFYNDPTSAIFKDARKLQKLVKSCLCAMRGGQSPPPSPGSRRLSSSSSVAMVPKKEGGGEPRKRPAKNKDPTGVAGSTTIFEAEALRTTLRELYKSRFLAVGARLTFNKVVAILNLAGDFICRLSQAVFPTLVQMRDIQAAGGFSSNSWAPVKINDQTLLQLQQAQRNITVPDVASTADDTALRLWQDTEDSYQAWLTANKRTWSEQRTARKQNQDWRALARKRVPPLARSSTAGDSVEPAAEERSPISVATIGLRLSHPPATAALALDPLPNAPLDHVTERLGAHVMFTDDFTARQEACFSCASYLDDDQNDDFVYCAVCAEPYHLYCTNLSTNNTVTGDPLNWRCPLCKFCKVCQQGRPRAQLLDCSGCGHAAHADCVNFTIPAGGLPRKWFCPDCIKCQSCGATTPGSTPGSNWMFDFTLCQTCGDLRLKGNFCPVCNSIYADDDYDVRMMQCETCSRWLHAKCDGIADDVYEALSTMANICYECPDCRSGAHSSEIVKKVKEVEENRFQDTLKKIFGALKRNQKSWFFLEPPDAADFPDYGAGASRPHLLQQLEPLVEGHHFLTVTAFVAAVRGVLDYCRQYFADEPNRFSKFADEVELSFYKRVARYFPDVEPWHPSFVVPATAQTLEEGPTTPSLTATTSTVVTAAFLSDGPKRPTGEALAPYASPPKPTTSMACTSLPKAVPQGAQASVNASAVPAERRSAARVEKRAIELAAAQARVEEQLEQKRKECEHHKSNALQLLLAVQHQQQEILSQGAELQRINTSLTQQHQHQQLQLEQNHQQQLQQLIFLFQQKQSDPSDPHVYQNMQQQQLLSQQSEWNQLRATQQSQVTALQQKAGQLHQQLIQLRQQEKLIEEREQTLTQQYKDLAEQTRVLKKRALGRERRKTKQQQQLKLKEQAAVSAPVSQASQPLLELGAPTTAINPTNPTAEAAKTEEDAAAMAELTEVSVEQALSDIELEDERRCVLCGDYGECVDTEGGRLLPLKALNSWIHVNCALWSAEVFEADDGALMNVSAAVRRTRTMKCSDCGRCGATVGCCQGKCPNTFHFPCAMRAGCQFLDSKEVFCMAHRRADLVPVSNFSVCRHVFVLPSFERARQGRNVAGEDVINLEQARVRVGAFVLERIGSLLPQNNAFSGPAGLIPLGYKAIREFWSTTRGERCVYSLEIGQENSTPVFFIKSSDGYVVKGPTPESAWALVVKRLKERLQITDPTWKPPFGSYIFGLSLPPVIALVERLPGSLRCRSYVHRFFRPSKQDQRKVLQINPTGCARGEPFIRLCDHGEFNPFPSNPANEPSDGDSARKNVQGISSSLAMAMQYRHSRKVCKDTVRIGQSSIHDLGLFAKRPLMREEMLIEYAGEQIRGILCDKREAYYDRHNIGTYMFRIDEDLVIDATQKGNAARFINHCCEPNCCSRVITVDGVKKIMIFAQRDIQAGEELTYDYKFPIEETKIPCHCGAVNCRGTLN